MRCINTHFHNALFVNLDMCERREERRREGGDTSERGLRSKNKRVNEKGGGLLTCGATKVRLSAMAATVNLAPGCSCGRVAVGRWSMLSIGQARSWREPGLEREREGVRVRERL